MGAIISFFRPAPTTQGAWSQQELAEFYRVEAALIRAGMRITCEQGLSDENDPWFVFCRPNGDAIMHFARIDGSYVVASEALEHPMRGPDFRSLLNQIAAQYPTLLPIPRAEPGAKLVVHPAALLTAIIAAAALSLSPEEAFASGIAPVEPEGRVPVPPAAGSRHVEPPSPARTAEERGADAPEHGDHRRQIEAIVFSAMLFAAQTASVDDLDPQTNPELTVTRPASHTADQAAQGDVALPPVPAAGGRAPDPGAPAAPSPAPALARQAHTDATPSGAEHSSVIQQSRPDIGFEGPDFPKLPAVDHPTGLKPDGLRQVRSIETGHPRTATDRPSSDHRPAETASASDGSAEVKQTSAAPSSPPAGPAAVGSAPAVSTPAGPTEESGSKVQQSAAQAALQVTSDPPAAAASELRFNAVRVLSRPDPKPADPAPEPSRAAGPAIDTPGPAKADARPAVPPAVPIEADAGHVPSADGPAPRHGRSQSPALDLAEPVLRAASDQSAPEARGARAEAAPGTPGAVGTRSDEAGAGPAQGNAKESAAPTGAAAGRSTSAPGQSPAVDTAETQKAAGPRGPDSDASPSKANGPPDPASTGAGPAEASQSPADHTASGKGVSGPSPAVGISTTVESRGAGKPSPTENAASAAPPKAGTETTAPEASTAASGQGHAGAAGTPEAATRDHPGSNAQGARADAPSAPPQA
ncbi:MAG: hypothetical protein K2X71_13575, partial [Methylobacterium sp.]|nr:hypothetical protein [Methylobacterium sp.]